MPLNNILEKPVDSSSALPLNDEQIGEIVIDALASTPPGDMMVQRDGQLVLPTGVYVWADKSYRACADPNLGLLDSDDDDENE